MEVVSLVEPALTLGVVSMGSGVGAFLLGVEPIGAILIAASIPVALIGIMSGLFGIMSLMERSGQRALNAIDPDWETKARLVNKRL